MQNITYSLPLREMLGNAMNLKFLGRDSCGVTMAGTVFRRGAQVLHFITRQSSGFDKVAEKVFTICVFQHYLEPVQMGEGAPTVVRITLFCVTR